MNSYTELFTHIKSIVKTMKAASLVFVVILCVGAFAAPPTTNPSAIHLPLRLADTWLFCLFTCTPFSFHVDSVIVRTTGAENQDGVSIVINEMSLLK